MRSVTLGNTGITVPQNAFGALPIQRVSEETAIHLLRKAFEGGMRFFDTARVYTDSEEKIGKAFAGMRDRVYIASKTMGRTGEAVKKDLETSLANLQTDHIDVYQLHCIPKVFRPGDGSGVYEALLEAKAEGKILHIGVTAHLIGVAEEAVESGLYETLQYPFSYLATDREKALVERTMAKGMGFICMKGLAGGLITNAAAAMAFTGQYENILPIWGVQREQELDQWLSFMEETPVMTPEIEAFIEKDRREFSGEFCRGCGYCMPCPQEIQINQCARISLMIRRARTESWMNEYWQKEVKKIETCLDCGQCAEKCPYGLDTPRLLKKNYEDYQLVLAGKRSVK